MIYIDSNIFVIDLRYPRDRAFPVNKRFLDKMAETGRGVTGLANLLEICGILSFNLPSRLLRELFAYFGERYRVLVLPPATDEAVLPGWKAEGLLLKMGQRMALKDAEIALTAERFVPKLDAFVTWNAKHFTGRIGCPVLTPAQWLRRSNGTATPSF